MEYFPWGWAGSSATALLRPPQPQQKTHLAHRRELHTAQKRQGRCSVSRSSWQPGISCWRSIPNSSLAVSLPREDWDEGEQQGWVPPAPAAPPGAHPKGRMWAVSSRKSCLAPECVSTPQVWGAGQVRLCPPTQGPQDCPGPPAQLGKSCPAHLSAHCLGPAQNKEHSNRKKNAKCI